MKNLIPVKLSLILVLMSFFTQQIGFSQNWFSPANYVLDSLAYGDMKWGDYDNDGDQDLIAIGAREDGTVVTTLLENNNNTFTSVNTPFFNAQQGSVSFIDYDNDNDLDVFISGTNDTYSPQSALYKNDNGLYSEVFVGIQNMNQSKAAWEDFDRDGDQDLFLSGVNSSFTSESILYENKGDTFVAMTTPITGVYGGGADWADVDHNGYPDLIITGSDGNGDEVTRLYTNNGSTFTLSSQNFLPVSSSTVKFMDFDADGNQDLVLMGSDVNGDNTVILYQNINGTFSQHQVITDIASSTNRNPMAWGDIDGDGDPDLVVSGSDNNYDYVCKVFRNNNGSFAEITNSGLPMVGGNSTVSFVDIDNDNDLDFALAGFDNSSVAVAPIVVYLNDSASTNTKPFPSSVLQHFVNNDSVSLHWNKSSDAQTSTSGLLYNLELKNQSTGTYYVTANSFLNGNRKVVAKGNMQYDTTVSYANLDYGVYKWKVQTIDNNYTASDFSYTDSFVISDLVPFHLVSPASNTNLEISHLENTPIDFTWNSNDSALTYKYQLFESSNMSTSIWNNMSNTSGQDTVISISESDLFNICYQSNHVSGHIKSYKWVAMAIGQYDSIVSMDTFQIHIKLKKTLDAFNLILPGDNNTEIIEKNKNADLNFVWNSSLGATSYKWMLASDSDPNFNTRLMEKMYTDTNVLILEDSIHDQLTNQGYPVNQNQKFLWRVIAFDAYDSLIAQQDFVIHLNLKDMSVGTSNLDINNHIKVYPAPFSDVFTIQNESFDLIENVQLLNLNGQIIRSIPGISSAQKFQVDARHIPNGIYFIKFTWRDSTQWIKIIKQ